MISAEQRTAPSGEETTGPVTLINSFQVAPERDDVFYALWQSTSRYFVAQPGFVSLRLHRAVNRDAPYRWVNVAVWDSEQSFRAASTGESFRAAVTAPGWEEFPSVPSLFEVVTSEG